ncbi:MAG: Ppx/GppA family phosphatase, partial [Anaerolineae bacterium]|nr:Ppx/GppA family phosphatase [Anaerolineae bacterium]
MKKQPPQLQHLDSLAQHSDVYKDSQRVAIIDMGSNSFRLIVVEYVPHLSYRMVDEVAESVRLGEGMAEANILRAAAMDRAVKAVQIYAAFCKASGIDDIIAVGTSAIRDAKNQQPFLARVEAETGIKVRVLSGEEEAYYGYLAAVNSTTLENGFVTDMGGGSIQVSRVVKRKIRESISLPLGAVRMTEQFLISDPVTDKEVDALHDFLEKQFKALGWLKTRRGMALVSEGGNVRMMGRIAQKADHYPLDMMHGYRLSLDQVKSIRNQLAERTISERKKLHGLKAERADISLGGVMVMYEA